MRNEKTGRPVPTKGSDAKTGTGTIIMMRNAKMDGKILDTR
jgi:hypothetical protein